MKKMLALFTLFLFCAVSFGQPSHGSGPITRSPNPSLAFLKNSTQSTWIEDATLRSLFPTGSCVMGGYLWGIGTNSEAFGVLAFNGVNIRAGGKTKNYNLSCLWTDGTRLYGSYSGTLFTCHARTGVIAGPFTQGEAVTQETTGAAGWYIRVDGSDNIYIMLDYGSADFAQEGVAGSYTITGATSGASIEVDVSTKDTGCSFLQMSTDGWTDFKVVQDIQDSMYPRSFVNCGVIGGKQLNMVFEVRAAATTPSSIWYNYPTDGDTWTLLGSTTANSIRHFHGGMVITDVNGTATDRLIVWTGDDNDLCSILVCDDIADLLANWATWKTRWALDLVGTRTTYLTVTNTAYNYGAGTQAERVTDLVIDADKTVAYYLPDGAIASGIKLNKIDLTAIVSPSAKTEVGTTDALSTGALGIRCSNGTMLFTTMGGFTWNGVAYVARDYIQCYEILPEIDDIVLLWEKPLVAHPTAGVWYNSMTEFPAGPTDATSTNPVWFETTMQAVNLPQGGAIVGKVASSMEGVQNILSGETLVSIPISLENLVMDGRFRQCWNGTDFVEFKTGWDVNSSVNLTGAKETTIVDAAGGNDISLKLAGNATTGAAIMDYALSSAQLDTIRGKYITLSVRYLWNNAQTAAVSFTTDINSTSLSLATSASWQTAQNTFYVPLTATTALVRLGCRGSGTNTDPTYFSDVSLVSGSYWDNLPRNIPSPLNLQGFFFNNITQWSSNAAGVTGASAGQVALYDTTSQAAGVGPAITLYANYTDAGAKTQGAAIKLEKTNGTSNQWGFDMALYTRQNGSGNLSNGLRLLGAGGATFGSGLAGIDYVRKIDGENSDLLEYWWEDEVTLERNGGTIYTPSATLDIVAATGLTAATHLIYTNVRIAGSGGAVNITANPQIAAGRDGQEITIQGDSDTNTVTFDDATGLALADAASFVMGKGDILRLTYDSGDTLWYEISRSNN